MSLELEYIAGFFDGEGGISAARGGKGYRELLVQISNTNRTVLEDIQQFLGTGVIMEYYPEPRKRRAFRYAVYANNAAGVLLRLLPWLRVKRDQALLAIEFQKAKGNVTVRERLGKQISAMNMKGQREAKYKRRTYYPKEKKA